MSGHTPGPWLQVASGPWVVGGGGRMVALLHTANPPAPHEYAANARLIAAAPEMLKALKVARDWLSDEDPEWEPRKIVDAAIAKAEGNS